MKNTERPFRPGAVLAVALGVALAMAGISAAVAVSARRGDEVAMHQQRQLLASALAERRLQAVLEAENVGTSNLAVEHLWQEFDARWAHQNIGLRLNALFGTAHVFLIDGSDRFVYAFSGTERVESNSFGDTLGHHSTFPDSTIARSFPKSTGLVSTTRIPYSLSNGSKYALRIQVPMAPPESLTTIWAGLAGSFTDRWASGPALEMMSASIAPAKNRPRPGQYAFRRCVPMILSLRRLGRLRGHLRRRPQHGPHFAQLTRPIAGISSLDGSVHPRAMCGRLAKRAPYPVIRADFARSAPLPEGLRDLHWWHRAAVSRTGPHFRYRGQTGHAGEACSPPFLTRSGHCRSIDTLGSEPCDVVGFPARGSEVIGLLAHMRRREFITLLGGAAAWPLRLSAQQGERMRRVGVLGVTSENDPQSSRRAMAFQEGLEKLGWMVGRNLQIDYRWGAADNERARAAAIELAKLEPDLMVANSPPAVRAVRQTAPRLPIVFVAVSEPLDLGFVSSLARPGGNITGFTNLEPSVASKWLEALKEIAPHLRRVALIINPNASPLAPSFFRSLESAAAKLTVDAMMAPVQEIADVEEVMTKLGREPAIGLIFPPDTFTTANHKTIVELAAQNRLPAIYAFQYFANAGGLIAYGPDVVDQFRRAASYVDRILRGEKAGDLPVQQPTKFELVINLKAANALGLTVPPTLLARADEVIE